MTDSESSGELAAELAALVDSLLPGDGPFPSARAIGLHGVFAARYRGLHGQQGLDALVHAMQAAGGPISKLSAGARRDALARLEAEQPELFQAARMVVYLSYYENPDVIAGVRALGHRYQESPQPKGYPMARFDPSDPQQAPTHRRGQFVPTDQVQRVDLSHLAEDPLAPEDVPTAGERT